MAKTYAILEGTLNGVNQTFTLPSGQTYLSGTIVLIHNGLTIHPSDTQGFTEVNSTTILLKIAPQDGDVLLALYDDGSVEDTALDVQITGESTNYQIEWNVQSYSITYNRTGFTV